MFYIFTGRYLFLYNVSLFAALDSFLNQLCFSFKNPAQGVYVNPNLGPQASQDKDYRDTCFLFCECLRMFDFFENGKEYSGIWWNTNWKAIEIKIEFIDQNQIYLISYKNRY